MIVNGRADIALAAGAVGVHLPSNGVSPAALRHRFGEGLLIGCSTHSLEEAQCAQARGADYVTFGPVFATPSKAAYGPPPGLEGLRQACQIGIPVIALGGIGAKDVAAIAAVGAYGVAGIRAFHDAGATHELVAASREAWPEMRPAETPPLAPESHP